MRDFIIKRAKILAVVSLPQTAFRRPHAKGGGGTGSGVKASLVFLRKKKEGEQLPGNYPIFMAIAEHIGYDSTGRPDKNEFPDIVEAYKKFRKKQGIDFFFKAPLSFGVGRDELENAFNPARYADKRPETRNWTTLKEYAVLEHEASHLRKCLSNLFDLIRIDDLENDSFEVTNLRTCLGSDLKGTYQQVDANDILITRLGPGILNKKFLVCPQTVNATIASNEFIRLKPKSRIDPYGLLAIFKTDYFVRLMFSKGRGATPSRFRLNREDFSKLPFPSLSEDQIRFLGKELRRVYRIKKGKEKEAEELLSSIDDYVLSELGIKLPELKEARYYPVTFAAIKGGRLDASYYQPKYYALEEALKRGKYPIHKLGEFISSIHYGASVKNIYAKEGIPLLRILNLRPNELNLFEVVILPFDKTKEIGNAYVKEGDFLISRSGTIGVTAIVPKEASGFAYGSFMIRFRIEDNEIEPFYISITMNSRIVQEQIKRVKIGAIQGNITIPSIKNLLIPLPPLAIQQKIAKEVNSRREKAKQLKQDSTKLVEDTKQKVEKMILGRRKCLSF